MSDSQKTAQVQHATALAPGSHSVMANNTQVPTAESASQPAANPDSQPPVTAEQSKTINGFLQEVLLRISIFNGDHKDVIPALKKFADENSHGLSLTREAILLEAVRAWRRDFGDEPNAMVPALDLFIQALG